MVLLRKKGDGQELGSNLPHKERENTASGLVEITISLERYARVEMISG